jgi:hypothetical protein
MGADFHQRYLSKNIFDLNMPASIVREMKEMKRARLPKKRKNTAKNRRRTKKRRRRKQRKSGFRIVPVSHNILFSTKLPKIPLKKLQKNRETK